MSVVALMMSDIFEHSLQTCRHKHAREYNNAPLTQHTLFSSGNSSFAFLLFAHLPQTLHFIIFL